MGQKTPQMSQIGNTIPEPTIRAEVSSEHNEAIKRPNVIPVSP
jgi:hypothetical protein